MFGRVDRLLGEVQGETCQIGKIKFVKTRSSILTPSIQELIVQKESNSEIFVESSFDSSIGKSLDGDQRVWGVIDNRNFA